MFQVHITIGSMISFLPGSPRCRPAPAARHEVRAQLLTKALAAGASPEVTRVAVCEVLDELARDGAKVIVCTCSTIGGLVEAAVVPNCTVLRVDRGVSCARLRCEPLERSW